MSLDSLRSALGGDWVRPDNSHWDYKGLPHVIYLSVGGNYCTRPWKITDKREIWGGPYYNTLREAKAAIEDVYRQSMTTKQTEADY